MQLQLGVSLSRFIARGLAFMIAHGTSVVWLRILSHVLHANGRDVPGRLREQGRLYITLDAETRFCFREYALAIDRYPCILI